MTDYSQMTDYEVFTQIRNGTSKSKNEATHEMWNRYTPLVMKYKGILYSKIKQFNFKGIDPEAYYPEAYETFLKALNSNSADKITNKPTWKFYIRFARYLQSHNRDIIYSYQKKRYAEMSYEASSVNSDDKEISYIDAHIQHKSRSIEDLAQDNINAQYFYKAVNLCLNKKFNATQKIIWKMKAEGKKKQDICQLLKIDSPTYGKEFYKMKLLFKQQLDIAARKDNQENVYNI